MTSPRRRKKICLCWVSVAMPNRDYCTDENLKKPRKIPKLRAQNGLCPPNRFGIKGGVANMTEFAEAFGCKILNKMARG